MTLLINQALDTTHYQDCIWWVTVVVVFLLNIYTADVDLQSRLCIFKSLAVPYVAIITFVHAFSIGL